MFQAEKQAMADENQKLRGELSETQQNHMNATNELQNCRNELQHKDMIIEQMTSKVGAQIEAARSHYQGAMSQLETANTQLNATQEQLHTSQERSKELQAERDNAINGLSALQAQHRNLRDEHNALTEDRLQITTQANLFKQQATEQLEKAQAALQTMQDQKTQAEQLRDQFKRQVMDLKMKEQRLLHEFQNMQKEKAMWSQSNHTAGGKLDEVEQENKRLKAQLFDMSRSGTDLRNEIEELKQVKDELIQMNTQLLDQLDGGGVTKGQ